MSAYNLSLYIPRISINATEEYVKKVFKNHSLALVNRVDFIPIEEDKPKPPGLEVKFQSAFVHFEGYFFSENSKEMYETVFEEGELYKFQPDVDSKEYWLLLKNNNPIPATRLNLHQVVENHRILEEKVLSQVQEIAELKNTINQIRYENDIRYAKMEQEINAAFEFIHQMRFALPKKTKSDTYYPTYNLFRNEQTVVTPWM
jgi:hypothetical protein